MLEKRNLRIDDEFVGRGKSWKINGGSFVCLLFLFGGLTVFCLLLLAAVAVVVYSSKNSGSGSRSSRQIGRANAIDASLDGGH